MIGSSAKDPDYLEADYKRKSTLYPWKIWETETFRHCYTPAFGYQVVKPEMLARMSSDD